MGSSGTTALREQQSGSGIRLVANKLLNLQTDANGDRDRDDNQVAADLEAMASLAVLDGADEGFSGRKQHPVLIWHCRRRGATPDLIARADLLRGKAHDPKLKQLIKELNALLKEGFRPVIFCRLADGVLPRRAAQRGTAKAQPRGDGGHR